MNTPTNVNVNTQELSRDAATTTFDHKYILHSTTMSKLARRMDKMALMARMPIIITGETGTGKEAAALYIHQQSKAVGRRGTFVKINTGAIPDGLFENILFGHDKGAYTDAREARPGLFEKAHRGTLFLDEIAEVSWHNQAKLLNFLDDFKVRRLGSDREIALDVRLMAATNADLQSLVANGKLREDLYYRLTALTLPIPPLRDHFDDLGPLTREFIKKINHENRLAVQVEISTELLNLLCRHAWPGNIRELYYAVQRAVVNSNGEQLKPEDFELMPPIKRHFKVEDVATPAEFEICIGGNFTFKQIQKAHLLAILQRNFFKVSKSARVLGIPRSTLIGAMKRFKIEQKP